MIAYILHCSIVWTIALLIFELWLRRTTFHGANRWYLNGSLALGLLLPLYQPATPHPAALPALELPLRELAVRQQRLQTIGEQASHEFNLGLVLLLVSSCGAAIQLSRLIREAVVLLRWRRNAVRADLFSCTVFITYAPHGPFSAFGAVYLSEIDAYSEDELRFILAHEQAHIRLRHSIDKCAFLLLRCLFWWHPLLYIYYSRLSLVQEFQADAPLRGQAPDYSRFLIDESLAVNGTGITHQFFHSPLKTRIRMLQRFATRNWQKAGYVAALALLAGGSFLWANKSLAHKEEKNGNVITFNGNRFETGYPPLQMADGTRLGSGGKTVVQIANAVPAGGDSSNLSRTVQDGKSRPVVSRAVPAGKSFTAQLSEIPIKMNGEPIFRSYDLERKAGLPDGRNLEQALIESYMPALSELPDGQYIIDLNMIIADAKGDIVYYKAGSVDWYVVAGARSKGLNFSEVAAAAGKEQEAHPIDKKLREQLNKELKAALKSISLTPAVKDGKPVIAYVESRNATTLYVAEIRNGKVTALNRGSN